jgi:hypothetical protein
MSFEAANWGHWRDGSIEVPGPGRPERAPQVTPALGWAGLG